MRFSSLVAVGCLLLSAASFSQQPYEMLADPEQQARYLALTQEVRCLTCLNRSIAESDTPLARDLRREIRELIAAGATDDEVAEFLTDRYGDFVLYRPPLQPRTYLLWAAPLVFFAIGTVIFGLIIAKRLRQPIEDADEELDGDEAGT